ncbi:MAG: hypothetical protein RR898_00615 [Clostridium sp.]|uniref:hypothetical protein n=1 Tax=Clostridium sp. TaxID=1506 RepID=UPI002FCA3D58
MTYVRNNIEIEGVDLKDGISDDGFVMSYWENGPVFLPKSKGKIRHLNKVIIEIEAIEKKILNTPAGKVLNIYARKIYSLIYSERSHERSQRTVLNLPFIAYTYLPEGVEDVTNLDVSVLDAFFEVIDNRKVYNHILYLIKFDKLEVESRLISESTADTGQLTLESLEKMILAATSGNVMLNQANQQTMQASIEQGNTQSIEGNNYMQGSFVGTPSGQSSEGTMFVSNNINEVINEEEKKALEIQLEKEKEEKLEEIVTIINNIQE